MKKGMPISVIIDTIPHPATVNKIVGTGDSLAKIVDAELKGGGEIVEKVVHERDAVPGEPYWVNGTVRKPQEPIEAVEPGSEVGETTEASPRGSSRRKS